MCLLFSQFTVLSWFFQRFRVRFSLFLFLLYTFKLLDFLLHHAVQLFIALVFLSRLLDWLWLSLLLLSLCWRLLLSLSFLFLFPSLCSLLLFIFLFILSLSVAVDESTLNPSNGLPQKFFLLLEREPTESLRVQGFRK